MDLTDLPQPLKKRSDELLDISAELAKLVRENVAKGQVIGASHQLVSSCLLKVAAEIAMLRELLEEKMSEDYEE